LPAYLHRFGPKKYKSVFLAFCWFITQKWTRSLRETQRLLLELNLPVPHWTTIQKAASRFTLSIWSLLHKITVLEEKSHILAVDSTSFSLTNPSRHYTNVIAGKVKCPAKLSVLVDTKTNKALALCFRSKPAHDTLDFERLIERVTLLPDKIVGDSAYDAEDKVFEPCFEKGIKAVIKPYKNRKRGFYRHKMRKYYDLRTYHRRPVVEGFFSRLKQKFGGNLRCRKAHTQQAETYARVILQNLSSAITGLFLQQLKSQHI
jgi:hypothetical protein